MAIYEGWHHFINQLLAAIDIEMLKHPGVLLTVGQVKEKLGGLRFYFNLSDGAPDELFKTLRVHIDAAEELAWNKCEQCGGSGPLRVSGGCYLVSCENHAPKCSKIVKGVNRLSTFRAETQQRAHPGPEISSFHAGERLPRVLTRHRTKLNLTTIFWPYPASLYVKIWI
jgi:hypothetical protein